MTEGWNEDIDAWINKANAVLCELYRPVATKWEFSNAAQSLAFQSVFVPLLTYGHESWVMSERVLCQVQAAGIGFLPGTHGVTLRNKVRSFEIGKAWNVEPLLQIEKPKPYWQGLIYA